MATEDTRRTLPGVDNKYNFNYFKFPTDLTQSHNNHYMVIQINVPIHTTTGNPRGNYVESVFRDGLSKVDQLNTDTNAAFVGGGGRIGGVNDLNRVDASYFDSDPLKYFYTRGTRRISDAIALFMPTPIIYNTVNDYEEIKLTQLFGSGIAALAGSMAGRRAAAQAGTSVDAARDAATGASGAVESAGRIIGRSSQMFGYPINPKVEVLFSNTKLRQYVFEFLLAPTSEAESKTIDNIIRTLRFHSAPELEALGLFFIPPAELDITFYHNGKENRALPRINTCVVDRIEVDYTPQQGQYTAFSNGYPVTTRLSLGLREVEIVHKARVYEGF
jgi:hypothetical protein